MMTSGASPNPQPAEMGTILKQARVIAVVGASRNTGKEAHNLPKALQKAGYRIIPVNPHADTIFDETAYPSLADVPSDLARTIDIVNLFRPGDQVSPHVEAAIDLNIAVIWMQQGIRNEAAAARARSAGAVVIQDQCLHTAYLLFGRS
ncbi:MAG: CoA-binding protein [Thermaerobacterales bacterium]